MAPLAQRERSQAVRAFAAGLSSATSLNRPKDWQAFERLTRDLFIRITGDVHMDLHGRNGQPQSGVDVSGVDQRTRIQVGIQCRGRGDGSIWTNSRLTQKELREEVAKARSFYPKLDIFVVLTTGPNDVRLKKAAAEISARHARDGSFEVQVHGWDWLEGRLGEHADLAIRYGLITVVNPSFDDAATASAIAKQIGLRLTTAVELMNDQRSVDERFTLQSISKHLGLPDWRKLEAVAEGRSDVSAAELVYVARALGINEHWLFEGKQKPFLVDPEDYRGAEEQFESIQRLNPRRIVFVRQREEDFESIVVAEIDEFRWVTFNWDHPTSSHVGGTGRYQLLEYCRLIRRLYRTLDHPNTCTLHGKHLGRTEFMRLWEGNVYPGTFLHWGHNDHWWMDFAELADERVEGTSESARELREAIRIARLVLADHQGPSKRVGWMRSQLVRAGIPVNERKPAARYPLDLGLSRD
ncbi:hypothetical protein [Bradyrhizobium sp. SK17]|uniref:hypothetical protein n=1 Tax=Bradyrhizobium sp. SK17 TaxID=2057741 RepID=UPI0012FE14FA|nr:hypothetical protein [Bradyrhizobium sp. SK17]